MIEHPTNYMKLCWVEVDSCANTCCAGATFKLIADTGRTADVEGFHGNLGKLEGIPIGTCYTAINHPVLQETIIRVFHQCLYLEARNPSSIQINFKQMGLLLTHSPSNIQMGSHYMASTMRRMICTFHFECMGAQVTFLHGYQLRKRLQIVDKLFLLLTRSGTHIPRLLQCSKRPTKIRNGEQPKENFSHMQELTLA